MEPGREISILDDSIARFAEERIIELKDPAPLVGSILAIGAMNCGFKLDDDDFGYIVKNLIQEIRRDYPDWLFRDVAEAIWMGSTGRYGTIYRFTLSTVCEWLKAHKGVIGWRALEASWRESDEKERLRVELIDLILQRLHPVYMREIRLGIKSWGSLYVIKIPKLLKRLSSHKPTIEELAYILTEYGKKRENTPQPADFLRLIRSQGLITPELTEKIHLFINDLIKDSDNDGSAEN